MRILDEWRLKEKFVSPGISQDTVSLVILAVAVSSVDQITVRAS